MYVINILCNFKNKVANTDCNTNLLLEFSH